MNKTVGKATEDTLDALHNLVANTLVAQLENPGEFGIQPAMLAQALKFLKDNGIDSPVRAQKVADTLAAKMPSFDPEDSNVVAMRSQR